MKNWGWQAVRGAKPCTRFGLLPNTAFVMDVLELNAYGEIVIDCQTRTGVPGVYAAGDVTNVRDKQVLVAAGEGVKAALRAHEYLLAGR